MTATTIDRTHVGPPSWWNRLSEATWPVEATGFAAMTALWPARELGDGHPVLVLPGFTASDVSTVPLRFTLSRFGFDAHGWNLGRNVGPLPGLLEWLHGRVDELYRVDGRRVSIVGWSLGGIYARAIARVHPDAVRQVITLGSPYRVNEGDRTTASPLWERFQHLHEFGVPLKGQDEEHRAPLRVPATSIYTRNDGVAPWQLCIDETGRDAPNRRAENVRVFGTHVGLGVNASVIYAVIDRLRQAESAWQPFRPPFALRSWYPRPETWASVRRTLAA